MELSNIISIVAALLSAIGLFFVAWQIKESEKSRQLQATMAIFDSLDLEESRALRRFVYNNLPQNVEDFSDDIVEKFEQICADFERIAIVANRRLVNKNLILAMPVGTVIMCWEKLEPFIRRSRSQRLGKLYFAEFEKFANDAKKYWRKHEKNKPFPSAGKLTLNTKTLMTGDPPSKTF